MVSVCSTFAFATETSVDELKNYSTNEKTAKSTGFWPSVWNNWCVDKEITDEIETYELAELNTLLEHFYDEVNNKKSEDYEPESLKVMMASLDRHLKNKGCTLSIVCDREFSRPKRCWRTKRNSFAWLAVHGKRPNKARQVSKEEEEILWKSGKLGGNNPESLIQTD